LSEAGRRKEKGGKGERKKKGREEEERGRSLANLLHLLIYVQKRGGRERKGEGGEERKEGGGKGKRGEVILMLRISILQRSRGEKRRKRGRKEERKGGGRREESSSFYVSLFGRRGGEIGKGEGGEGLEEWKERVDISTFALSSRGVGEGREKEKEGGEKRESPTIFPIIRHSSRQS